LPNGRSGLHWVRLAQARAGPHPDHRSPGRRSRSCSGYDRDQVTIPRPRRAPGKSSDWLRQRFGQKLCADNRLGTSLTVRRAVTGLRAADSGDEENGRDQPFPHPKTLAPLNSRRKSESRASTRLAQSPKENRNPASPRHDPRHPGRGEPRSLTDLAEARCPGVTAQARFASPPPPQRSRQKND